MPFLSKAQLGKFASMEKRGEIPKGTFRRWLDETPNVKNLPKRVHHRDVKEAIKGMK